jgi:glycosyltransferase involved in cell wall biosynthesis
MFQLKISTLFNSTLKASSDRSNQTMVENSKIHLGILYIGKQGGVCHYTYELVRAISKNARVTCYLSANNVLLDKFYDLPCQIKTFDTYDSFLSLLWSMSYQKQLLSVAKEINKDMPDILLDSGSGPWAAVIKKAILSKRVFKHHNSESNDSSHENYDSIKTSVFQPLDLNLQTSLNTLLVDVVHDVEIHPDRWLPLLKIYRFFYPNSADASVGISDYSCRQMLLKLSTMPIIKSAHGIIQASPSIDLDRIAKNRNKFLFFGRIEKYKGIELLVKSFAIARQIYPNISLSIVGHGLISEQLKKQILGLNIQLINRWVSEDELSEIVDNHGVMIMPYLSATQSGVAAVSLGNGLPAVATNVGALPEQIIHNRNGLIVPKDDAVALANAMLEISKDYTCAYKMAREACLIADAVYSWEKIANNLLEDLINLSRKQLFD